MSGNPEALLRGALEKIVYFECRLSQLESELTAAREVASREREGAAAARGREAVTATDLARFREEVETARHHEGELSERVRLLEGERERFLTGLIDQARIAGAPSEGESAGEEADLAGFIAELRAEIELLRPWKVAAELAGLRLEGPAGTSASHAVGSAHAGVDEIARGFEASGRLSVSRSEAIRLEGGLEIRAERSLYESSMDDLASTDRHARRRAADALRAMGSRAAAPLVASAVGRERDEEVKVALLAALGALGETAAAEVAGRELSDPRPGVRAAALDALSALSGPAAESRLLGALGDPSPLVRRRAVLLLGFAGGPAAEEALRATLSDRDPGVARAAALALSGLPTASAQGALTRALDHGDESVRRVASKAVARWSGESVAAAAPAEDRRRAARRISEKLAAVGATALRDAVVDDSSTPTRRVVPAVAAPAPARARVASAAAPRVHTAAASAASLLPRAAVVVVVEAGPGDFSPIEEAVLLELRSALRGRTLDEVAGVVPGDAGGALDRLVVRGVAVRRGTRYFPA